MRVAPRENGSNGNAPDLGAKVPVQEPDSGHQPLDAMRSWLLSGVQFVDRRRRFGAHGRARELLVVDRPAGPEAAQRLQTLTSALHRYTVRSGLSELSPEHRRVITLAYLEGRTNREIAAALGVSITTVRRRLWVALSLLEVYITRSGAWLLAPLLVAAIYALNHSTRFVRWVSTAANSADKAQRLAATVTAGAVATAALGIVAFTTDTPTPGKTSRSAGPSSISQSVLAAGPLERFVPAIPRTVTPLVSRPVGVPHTGDAGGDASAAPPIDNYTHRNGCHGNPTSAPPDVPVGPRPADQTGPPVTHPGPGGCQG